MSTVGAVGVGNMGGGMAARLLETGWTVRACDLAAERVQDLVARGAVAAGTPAEAAAGAEALIVCVVDAVQTREVLFGPAGAVETLAPGSPVLLCPTIAPQDVVQIAQELHARGLAPIDCPMSGGPARARDGTMSLMVACEEAAHARAGRLIGTLSNRVFRVGTRWGDGARTKLVNNLLAGINLVGAAEALALARRLGLDPATTLDVIGQSSGQSWIGEERLRRALAGEGAPLAHMTLLHKDTRLALEAAAQAGFAGPLGPHAHAVFDAAVQAGWGARDDGALLAWLEAGAPPRTP